MNNTQRTDSKTVVSTEVEQIVDSVINLMRASEEHRAWHKELSLSVGTVASEIGRLVPGHNRALPRGYTVTSVYPEGSWLTNSNHQILNHGYTRLVDLDAAIKFAADVRSGLLVEIAKMLDEERLGNPTIELND